MKSLKIIIVLVTVIFLSGCSSIKVYRSQDADDPKKQGIKAYPPKPYIVVARAGENGKIISVTPVMLPDLSDPHYIRQISGLGSANLTLGIEGGVLKTFGGNVDTKIPETITSIGGLATSYGALVKSLSEAGKLDEEGNKLRRETADTEKISATIGLIESANDTINEIKAGNPNDYKLSKNQTDTLTNVSSILEETAAALQILIDNPNVDKDQDVLDEHVKKLFAAATAFEKVAAGFPEDVAKKHSRSSVTAEIRAGASKIKSKPVAVPVFDLYEIDNSDPNGITVLKKVTIP